MISTPQQPEIKKTILLIEDDCLLLKMYKTKFTMEGFEVLTAEDGEAGLKIALEKKVDFIIMDIMMPKLSGLDLLAQLKKTEKGKNIPVIILSNLARPEKQKQALDSGAKEFLVKANVTPAEVVAKVQAYFKK